MWKKFAIAALLILSFSSVGWAQKKITLTGTVIDSDGNIAINAPITFSVPYTQAFPNGFVLTATSYQIFTNNSGMLPAGTTAIQGGVYVVTVRDGQPIQVTMPPIDTLDLAAILGEVQQPQPVDLIDKIQIGAGGQYHLLVQNPIQFGTATLTPSDVFGFTLQQDGDANNHKIKRLTAAVTAGDAIAYDQTNAELGSLNVVNTTTSKVYIATQQIDNAQTTQANLPALAAEGTQIFCTDCFVGETCNAGGTGALAQRINGAWSCGLVSNDVLLSNLTINDCVKWQSPLTGIQCEKCLRDKPLTCSGGGSTCTDNTLMPNAGYIYAVLARVGDDVVGCSNIEVGDGTTADLWGGSLSPSLSSTTTLADYKNTWIAPKFYNAAVTVTLTCSVGTFTSGRVDLTAVVEDCANNGLPTPTTTSTPTSTPTVTPTAPPPASDGGDFDFIMGGQPQG